MDLENFVRKVAIFLTGGAITYLALRNGALKLKDSSEKVYHLERAQVEALKRENNILRSEIYQERFQEEPLVTPKASETYEL